MVDAVVVCLSVDDVEDCSVVVASSVVVVVVVTVVVVVVVDVVVVVGISILHLTRISSISVVVRFVAEATFINNSYTLSRKNGGQGAHSSLGNAQ